MSHKSSPSVRAWASNFLASTLTGLGAFLVGFISAGVSAIGYTVGGKLRTMRSIADYGVTGTGLSDESAAVLAMLGDLNYVFIPEGFTVQCKNIPLVDSSRFICDGVLKLPSACSDFDRLLYAADKSRVKVKVAEIDGNAAGQSGSIGTHLCYFTGCDRLELDIGYAHDHFVNAGATMPSVDGIRNTSSGAVFVESATKSTVRVNELTGWGREGVYLLDCTDCVVDVGYCLGTGQTEYSGVQVSGTRNKLLRASVENCGASGIGFDTTYGQAGHLVSINSRENHGVNFGHPGRPADGSVIESITVDGCELNGVQFQSSSQDVTVGFINIRNAGQYGVNASDSVLRAKIGGGVIANSGTSNYNAYGAEISAFNVKSTDLDAHCLFVAVTSGTFTEGETVTSASGSGVARRVVGNLGYTDIFIFVPATTGSWSATQVITGATSGATGTITAVKVPVQYTEASGGRVNEHSRYASGAAGNQTRFADGTAILSYSTSIALTGGTAGTITINYASNVLWASAPLLSATVSSANSTSAYDLSKMQASSTTTVGTVIVKCSVTQTYGVAVLAVGRWK